MDACLPRFTRPPGSTHPRGGPARCSFMRGLTDRTSYLGRVGAIGFGEPTVRRPTCLCRHCDIAGEGAGILQLKETDPLHQLRSIVSHVADLRPDLPCLDRAGIGLYQSRCLIGRTAHPVIELRAMVENFAQAPLIDRCRWRCRHHVSRLARALRPTLPR